MDLLLAPQDVVDALIQRLQERAEEAEKKERQDKLRAKLRKSMGR